MFEQFIMEGNESSFSNEKINIWAREVANNYITSNKPMHEKIAEIASVNSLNPEQIQRIVETANLAVESVKKGEDFQVARLPEILKLMKTQVNEEAPEGDLSDYLKAPEGTESKISMDDLFGVKPQETGIPQTKIIQIKIIKLANARKAIDDHLTNLEIKKTEDEKNLIKIAKQCIMQDHMDINDLYAMVKEAGYSEILKPMFDTINHVLVKQGVIEKTAFMVQEDLISKDLNKNGIPSIKIVNGNHAIIKSFQTFQHTCDDIVHARRALVFCDGKLKKFKEEAKRVS